MSTTHPSVSNYGATKNLSYIYGEERIRGLFNSIVKHYDLLNTLMSAGAHYRWRRIAVDMTAPPESGKALDVCCGTGDFSIALKKKMGEGARVFGIDFSGIMVTHARKKIGKKRISGINFTEGNALDLPFADSLFDVAVIGFGMRNLTDIDRGLKEIRRVLVSGGRVAVLEIVNPENGLLKPFFSLWFDKLVPRIGQMIYGDKGPYDYLPLSVKRYPSPALFSVMMKDAGFNDINYRSLGGGIIALHAGRKD